MTVNTFYDMIMFAFNTQVLPKQLTKIIKSDQNNTLTSLFSSTKEEHGHKPYLLASKGVSKAFERQKQELLSSKKFAQSSLANKDIAANAFLPLYPVFKDVSVHHVLADDLKATIST